MHLPSGPAVAGVAAAVGTGTGACVAIVRSGLVANVDYYNYVQAH